MFVIPAILVGELALLIAFFLQSMHQYHRLKSYTSSKYPEIWKEYGDSGRLGRWIRTNARDQDILRRAASADAYFEGLLHALDKTRSRYIKTFLLAIATFVCATLSLPFIAK